MELRAEGTSRDGVGHRWVGGPTVGHGRIQQPPMCEQLTSACPAGGRQSPMT